MAAFQDTDPSFTADAPPQFAVDPNGNSFIADTHNSRIRKVTAATGLTTTGAGVAGVCTLVLGRLLTCVG